MGEGSAGGRSRAKRAKKARSGEADEQGFYGRRKWKNLPANLAKRAQTLTTTGMGERPPVRARKIKASWQLLNHPPRYYSLSLFLSLPLSLSLPPPFSRPRVSSWNAINGEVYAQISAKLRTTAADAFDTLADDPETVSWLLLET